MTFSRFGASMPWSMKNLIAVLAVAALSAGCSHPPPPAPPPPPPVAVAPPPPPPPPPPPKCEAPSEGCTGQNGTVARVRKSGFGIGVPNGWTYAQMEDATVISSNEAAVVVSTFEMGAGESNREGALVALINLLGVSPPRHRVQWGHPSKKSRMGGIDLLFWQADDVTKGLKKGPVLLFGAELPDKSWLMGAGFVPDDDKSDSDKAILSAVESIAPMPPPPPPAYP
jgi:hypothetical protein